MDMLGQMDKLWINGHSTSSRQNGEVRNIMDRLETEWTG